MIRFVNLKLIAVFPFFCLWAAVAQEVTPSKSGAEVTLTVLGTVQDGGAPHLGCRRACCIGGYESDTLSKKVVALGLLDRSAGKSFLIEAGPDIISQWNALSALSAHEITTPSGILLTHAHIGHYSGLMFLGREALNTNRLPVYAMPKMTAFLTDNGPWRQLVELKNIALVGLNDGKINTLTEQLAVVPFIVPHRDEYSETVGFEIIGPSKRVLFIPDIDKWERWSTSILEKIQSVDLAFVDATFYSNAEIGYRDVSEVPHPFVQESISLFENLSEADRKKIYFIHLNHTNPLLNPETEESKKTTALGYGIARLGMVFKI